MANETLTIKGNDARLTVIGKSWADVTTDSGDGITIDQLVIEEIEDIIGIDLPDIDDETRIIVGYDESGDPWLYIDGLDDPYDLGDLDLSLLDLDFELGSTILAGDLNVSIDSDLSLTVENIPTTIEIVTPPKKLEYTEGDRLDLTGMVVTAKKSDGSTWTSAKYPNGHIPLGELIADPLSALLDVKPEEGSASLGDVNSMQYSYGPAGNAYWPNILVWNAFGPLAVSFSGLDAQTGSPIHLSWDSEHKVWWGSIDLNGQNPSPIYGPVALDARTLLPYEAGDGSSSKRIIVTWLRPGDSEPLSAYFDITVEPRRGNGGR